MNRAHRIKQLHGSRVLAVDGEIGKVCDVYFDDMSRCLRYLVVDTGGWLTGRKVLISPQAVELINHSRRTVSLLLNRERIEGSPDSDMDKPVSRQHEREIVRYYGYIPYWAGATRWATGSVTPIAALIAADLMELQERRLADEPSGDTHLRSTRALSNYTVNALDGSAGHVWDFLFNEETWAVDYLVIATGMRPFGRRVLVSTAGIQHLDRASRSVAIGVTREQIRRAAEFNAATSLNA